MLLETHLRRQCLLKTCLRLILIFYSINAQAVDLCRDSPESHPRTPDNLEVVRRWEDVRARNWLTQEQKLALRKLEQEHTLLVDEGGQFVLVTWEQVERLKARPDSLRAFSLRAQRKYLGRLLALFGRRLLGVESASHAHDPDARARETNHAKAEGPRSNTAVRRTPVPGIIWPKPRRSIGRVSQRKGASKLNMGSA
jgi:hypothetical protein